MENNPFTTAHGDTLVARLYWLGVPLADTQVSIFHRALDGGVSVLRARTDRSGSVRFMPDPGFYLLNAVRIEPPSARLQVSTGAVWHSQWASLTFHFTGTQ